MMRSTARVARKPRRCTDCRRQITSGETYLHHVASPNDPELGNETWWRMAECSTCATRDGRGAQIDARNATAPTPEGQAR
jgi:predicted RNA-binding Zn-ribbon protein involved in translation (DUF1610 family)